MSSISINSNSQFNFDPEKVATVIIAVILFIFQLLEYKSTGKCVVTATLKDFTLYDVLITVHIIYIMIKR